ncbi:MAG: hypothetical protein EBY29_12750, partial [Planctomycetes bacterium]|nr:hypothetical protein [Planctomycetota bacterium]
MFFVGIKCDYWIEFKVSNLKSKINDMPNFTLIAPQHLGNRFAASICGIDLGNRVGDREGEMSQRGFRRLSMNVRSPVILSIVVSIILSIILSQPAIARDNFWQPLAPIEGGWIACSAYDSVTDTIYIGTNLQSSYGGTSTDGTILKSSDHGVSWVDIGAGLSALTQFHRVSGITRTASGALFVALDGGGVARTLDGGANWALMNTGLQIGNCPSCAKINSIRFAPDGTGYISITKDTAPVVVPSGTYTVGITGSGALATYGVTTTLTIVKNIGYVTGMTAVGNANLVFDTTNNGVANATLSAATISAAKAATSITFSFTGGNYV